MLMNVKEKALAGLGITADFIEACADRQIGFATFCLQSSLQNAKRLRHSKSLNDVINVEKDYLKGLQDQLTELAKANTEALKTFGGSTKDYVTGIIKSTSTASTAPIESVIAAQIEADKKIVRKSL